MINSEAGLESPRGGTETQRWEAHIHRCLGLVPDAVYRLNREGVFLWASAGISDWAGRSPVEVLGRGFEEFFPPDQTGLAWSAILSNLADSNPFVFQHVLRLAVGEKWVETRLCAASDAADGEILGLSRDVTERQQAEDRLRQLASVQRTILYTINIGITYLKNRIHEWGNPAFAAMFGYSVDELPGTPTAQYYVRQEDYRRVGEEGYAQLASAGIYTAEFLMRRKDGSHLWCGITGQAVNPKDLAEGTIWALQDITERKRTEEALRKSEAQLRGIARNIPGMVFQFYARPNGETGLHYVSERSIDHLGLDNQHLESFLERFVANLAPEDRARFHESVRLAVTSVVPWEFEGKYMKPNGETVFLRGVSQPRQLGQEIVFDGLFLDITERKLAETALRASLEEKEALLKEVHHRVKNNLQIVTSLLGLQSARETQDSVKAALRDMQSRIWAMALLHDALYRSASLARVDFGAYVRNLCTQLTRSYQRGNQPVRFDIQVPDLGLDLERAVPCGLILSELITNAFKHAFPDGRSAEIRVAARHSAPGEIEIGVADNGIGLPPDFDPAKARSLGLQLVWRLVGQIEGRLRRDPGPGTGFRLQFPVSR